MKKITGRRFAITKATILENFANPALNNPPIFQGWIANKTTLFAQKTASHLAIGGDKQLDGG